MTKEQKELIINCLRDGKTNYREGVVSNRFSDAIAIIDAIQPDAETPANAYLTGYGKAMAELASLKAEWFSEGYEEGRSDFAKDEE